MGTNTVTAALVVLLMLLCAAGCREAQPVNLWEKHCAACHDGKTILNGHVVANKEQMRAKYKTVNEFADSCGGSTTCMNILKHDKKLFEAVGREIGIGGK